MLRYLSAAPRFLLKILAWLLRLVRRRSNTIAVHFKKVVELAAAEEAREPAINLTAPAISFVVPVFDTPPRYLDDLLKSFQRQVPGASELVLSDDGSSAAETRRWLDEHRSLPGVKVVANPMNAGIAQATNAGIAQAVGAWVGLVDHDDALAPHAVARILRALAGAPHCRFLYTDEVITNARLAPVDYFLKPAWDPVLLSGVNYVNHLSLYRRDRLTAIGGLRDGFQGSQDYDLLLRYTSGLADEDIIHLPYPAYLWRRDGSSFSALFLEDATTNARRALAQHHQIDGRDATVGPGLSADLHRVRFDMHRSEWPKVSAVIPSRDSFDLISPLLDALCNGTDYPNLEIIVIDNGSKDPRVLDLYRRHEAGPIPMRAYVKAEPFNFSRLINRGLAAAQGDLLLLLNNDIEILEPNWLKEMVSCFDYPRTGIVGAKLLYPDRTIQHVGVIVGLGQLAGHWFIELDEHHPGPMGRLRVRQSLSCVTGACLMMSRACLAATGPLDEDIFAIAYNDVDLCLRALAQGFRIVWTPFATLVHHESASRGSDETTANIERFRRDKASLQARHNTHELEDRAFNPWYSRDRSQPVPVLRKRLPKPR